MVWKRRYFGVLALVVFVSGVVGVLVVTAFQAPEPEYRGRKLRQLAPAEYGFYPGPRGPVVIIVSDHSEEFREAITHIGTNAIPLLLKWIQYERSPIRDWCYRVVNPIIYRLKPAWGLHPFGRENRAASAVLGLRALGAKAEAAVPRLAELMNDPRAPKTSDRASQVITALSFYLVAADLVLMTNTDVRVRLGAIQGLERLDGSGASLKPAIPTLIQCLRDKDPEVAKAAVAVLGRLAIESELVVPALIESLERPVVRMAAIKALAGFHTQASAAIPRLKELANDPVPLVRTLANNALQQIDRVAVDIAGKE